MFDRQPPGGRINAVPFQSQDFASAKTIQGSDLHEGIDRVVTDCIKEGFELVGIIIAGLIALLFRKLNKLTGIRLNGVNRKTSTMRPIILILNIENYLIKRTNI